ncbi:MAG: hypothetical protein JWM12_3614 [Ilumatobacteraceae bacterium]|nr:hypothetical protein [Ilumatobacteraceae bacterium]
MIRQRLVAGAVTVTALVTLAACGSDKKSSSTTAQATTTVALSSDGTVASTGAAAPTTTDPATASTANEVSVPGVDDTVSITVPGGLAADCQALYQQMVSAMGGAPGDSTAKVGDVMKGMRAIVPDDLKDDVDVLAAGMTDPTKAGQPAFQTALANLGAWFASQGCNAAD